MDKMSICENLIDEPRNLSVTVGRPSDASTLGELKDDVQQFTVADSTSIFVEIRSEIPCAISVIFSGKI